MLIRIVLPSVTKCPTPSRVNQIHGLKIKVRGLDSRDQSRLRSRCLDTSRCRFSNCRDVLFQTVKNETLDRDLKKNREISIFRVVETVETWFLNCRENLDCRDVVFQTVQKISTVETDFFCVEIESLDRDHVETNQDPQGYSESQMRISWMCNNLTCW